MISSQESTVSSLSSVGPGFVVYPTLADLGACSLKGRAFFHRLFFLYILFLSSWLSLEMRIIEENLGPVLIGVFLNTHLYGIVTYQYLSYFGTRFQDKLWIKTIVVILFLIDTFHTASLIYMIWYYLVKNYGNPMALLAPVWPYPCSIFVTATIALLTHLLLSYRTLRLTNTYVYGGLVLLSTGSFILGTIFGVKTWNVVSGPADMGKLNPLLSAWLSTEVFTDALISGTLMYSLSKSRTGFQKSDTIIKRLMRTSIQTGLFSGMFSILTLAFYLALPSTQIFATFGLAIGRLYTNTLMDTLLCRETLRGLLNPAETNPSYTHTNSVKLTIQREVHSDFVDRPTSHFHKTFKSASEEEESG